MSRKIKIPSGDTNCFCVRIIPDYNIDTLPFIILRDRKGVSIVDIKSGKGWVLIESKFNYEPGNTKRLEVYRLPGEGLIQIIYCEFENKDSKLKKMTMPKEFLKALELIAD